MSEWVSVKSRLPEKRQKVIVTDNEGNVYTQFYIPGEFWDKHVVAWMPLPKAYENE